MFEYCNSTQLIYNKGLEICFVQDKRAHREDILVSTLQREIRKKDFNFKEKDKGVVQWSQFAITCN